MNKTELVDAIAESADLTKVQAKAALESTLNAISETLKKKYEPSIYCIHLACRCKYVALSATKIASAVEKKTY